jgi:glycosyltransferase involved in cell wall biosynthesis
MPKLSIITINLNNHLGLIRTVTSIQSQSFRDFENIIIDGGSTDDSVNWIQRNSKLFAYTISEKDNGIYDAMNKGLQVARGDYCLFLNSGDYLHNQNALANFWNEFELLSKEQSDFAILYCNVITHYQGKMPELKRYLGVLSNFYLCIEIINHQSQFIKTELLRSVNGFDLAYKLASDYELFLKLVLIEKAKYLHIPVVVSEYDMIGTSSSKGSGNRYQLERNEIRKKYLPGEYERAEIMDFFQTSSQFLLIKDNDLPLWIIKVIYRKVLFLVSSDGLLTSLIRYMLIGSYRIFNLFRMRTK